MTPTEMYELMLVDHQRELVFPQGLATPRATLRQLFAEGNKRNATRAESDERFMIFKNGIPYKEP